MADNPHEARGDQYDGRAIPGNGNGDPSPIMKQDNWIVLGEAADRVMGRVKKEATMKLVIIESPFSGGVSRYVEYARRCLRDSLDRGEAPIASHLLYTQPEILNDHDPDERQRGIAAGLAWLAVAHLSAVYVDHGVTAGMKLGIDAAARAGIPVEYRELKV